MTLQNMTLQKATKTDFDDPVLHDPQSGIFHGVSKSALKHILRHTSICSFETNETVFHFGQDTKELPVYIILSGKFAVKHELYGLDVEIASDEAGVVLADVELFVRDVDARIYKRGETNTALSTVVCKEAGKALMIFPPEILWQTKSFELARNMGKLVCFKLLRRNKQTDVEYVSETIRVITHLHDLVTGKYGHEVRLLKPTEGEQPPRPVFIRGKVVQKEEAKKIDIAPSTLNGVAKRLYEYDNEFYWHLGRIEMTKRFLKILRDEKEMETLWKREVPLRPKMARDKKIINQDDEQSSELLSELL